MSEWISVKDRLPEIDYFVLWCRFDGHMFIEHIDKDMDVAEALAWWGATHWQPLPEPPEVKS